MTLRWALVLAAGTMLAMTGDVQAQAFFGESRGIFGGPGFFGAGPVRRTVVMFPTNYAPGTIVISTGERRLYLVLGNGQALSYAIGVGKAGFAWSGVCTP